MRRINIIACGPTVGKKPQYSPEYGEFWGVNASYIYGKLDKLFVLDPPIRSLKLLDVNGYLTKFLINNPECELFTRVSGTFTNKAFPDFERKLNAFPLIELQYHHHAMFWLSTVDYMMSYAIYQKELGFEPVDEINVYGFESCWLTSVLNNGYCEQSKGFEYWEAVAGAKKITVNVPFSVMRLLTVRNPLYGAEYIDNDALSAIAK